MPKNIRPLISAILTATFCVSVFTSCESDRNSGGINRSEVRQLEELERDKEYLVQKLRSHFSDEEFNFILTYQHLEDDAMTTILKGPNLLLCDGPFTEGLAREADPEIQKIIAQSRFAGVEVNYLVGRDGNTRCYISSKNLSIRRDN